MSFRFARGSNVQRFMVSAIAVVALASCGGHSGAQDAQPKVTPRSGGGVFEPEPGREADFFRTVEVFIHVDFEKPAIKVVPYDSTCPNTDEALRSGRCNVVRIDVPVEKIGKGMVASQEETVAFMEAVAEGGRATRTVDLPRIFYPPNSTGRGSTQTSSGCRPDNPARQYQWTAQCFDGGTECMRPGDQVIIRPKVSDELSKCEVTIDYHEPNFAILDRLAAVHPAYNCARDFVAPKPPEGAPGRRAGMEAAMEYLGSDRFKGYVDRHNEYFEAKAKNDHRMAKTLFSPQTSGTLSISPVCPPDGSCPGCCQASVASGIPYRPRFLKPGSGVMWAYGIELWRGGKCVAEMDPGGWVEDDGPGG